MYIYIKETIYLFAFNQEIVKSSRCPSVVLFFFLTYLDICKRPSYSFIVGRQTFQRSTVVELLTTQGETPITLINVEPS